TLSYTTLFRSGRPDASLVRGSDDLGQVHETVRVAHLVVVPGQDLHQVAHRHRESGVEDRAVRRADDVGADQRLLAVGEHTGERALRGRGPERLVHLIDGDVAVE